MSACNGYLITLPIFGSARFGGIIVTFKKKNMDRLSEVHRWAFKEKSEDGTSELDIRAVPVRIAVELREFTVSNAWTWKDRFDLKEEEAEGGNVVRGFKASPVVKCKGRLEKDKISIFEYPTGTIVRTEEIYEITIRPIQAQKIGGDKNHSPLSSSAYLGFGTSLEIPKEGLMKGEVGNLSAWPQDDEYFANDPDFALRAELYICELIFDNLVKALNQSRGNPIMVMADIVAQLFHHEVDAALSEACHSQDYGLRVVGKSRHAYAPARLDILRIDIPIHQIVGQKQSSETGLKDVHDIEEANNLAAPKAENCSEGFNAKNIKQIRTLLIVIITILAAILVLNS